MSSSITVKLDTGQANLLVSALGIAASAVAPGDEYIGFPGDYHRLSDEIVAQFGDPAGAAARARLVARDAADKAKELARAR